MSVKFPTPQTEDSNDNAEVNVLIVLSRFNEVYTTALLHDTLSTLKAEGVSDENIFVLDVPGAYEIPFMVSKMATLTDYDVAIALGVVIAGDTNHHLAIEQSVAHSLQRISIDEDIPVINGVITVEKEEQAQARCLEPMHRGKEFAHVALEMARKSIAINNSYDMMDMLLDDDE